MLQGECFAPTVADAHAEAEALEVSQKFKKSTWCEALSILVSMSQGAKDMHLDLSKSVLGLRVYFQDSSESKRFPAKVTDRDGKLS